MFDEGQRPQTPPDLQATQPHTAAPTRGYRIHIVQIYGPPADAHTNFEDPAQTEIEYATVPPEDYASGYGMADAVARRLFESTQLRPDDWIEALLAQTQIGEDESFPPGPVSRQESFVFQNWQDTQDTTVVEELE